MIARQIEGTLITRLREPRRFLQVLFGPRQVGKTTATHAALERLGAPHHYVTADAPGLREEGWIQEHWEIGRALARKHSNAVLVLDEVQKLPGWSEIVKLLWDEDARHKIPLKVVLLGSAPLLVQAGLSESLAGRFEILRVTHWTFEEMRAEFGWDLDTYLAFGGYPGAAALVPEPERWARYIRDALIETTLSRDVLLMVRVDKPALLRQVFALACRYSGQELSYNKMLGTLQEAGNASTIAHYLQLLSGAGLVTPLSKFTVSEVRARASTPKLLALNNALITAQGPHAPADWRAKPEAWGRLVESAVGAHLVNGTAGSTIEVTYWRERDLEVDFVMSRGDQHVAIEVKSGRPRKSNRGMGAFAERNPGTRSLLVGSGGVPLEEFLTSPPEHWFSAT
ncbi:MAG: ATP-binding protein [Planctomycetes bacterium]|nr:ATP-binding protein [Planctomycetota bacterium]